MTAILAAPATTGHPVSVERAAEHADDLADRALPDPEGGLAGVAELLQAIDRLLAVAVTTLIRADRRAVTAAEGQTLPSWLRSIGRRTGADAGMLVAAAERLADMPATLTAFQTGVISWGTVRGIVSATRSLTAGQRRWVDAAISTDADRMGRVDADTIIDDAQALADRARPDLQQDRADRAAASQQLVLQPSVDGSGGTVFATLDAESFAAVTAAIDGIARDGKGRRIASNVDALRALARQRVTLSTDTTDDHDTNGDGDAGSDSDADAPGEPTAADATDNAGDGAGAAGCACADRPTVRSAPSTARPEIIVVTDIRMLTDPGADPYAGVDRRGTDTLHAQGARNPARGVAKVLWRHDRPAPRLTAHAARRLACDATIRPVLVDEYGRVLGTAAPYAKVSASLRAALAARDGGCRFTGCHAPVEVCDAHHLHHRADGGPTVMANLALLCGQHHRAVHEGGWNPTLDSTTGQMTFTRRGTTLHSHSHLPTAPTTGGPPPPGRPRRRTGRGRPPDDRPPDQALPAAPPDLPQPVEALPF